jgi:hypothetical protein
LNEILYAAVHDWAQGVPREVAGLDLADVLAYDLLRVLGRLLMAPRPPEEVGDGRTASV